MFITQSNRKIEYNSAVLSSSLGFSNATIFLPSKVIMKKRVIRLAIIASFLHIAILLRLNNKIEGLLVSKRRRRERKKKKKKRFFIFYFYNMWGEKFEFLISWSRVQDLL